MTSPHGAHQHGGPDAGDRGRMDRMDHTEHASHDKHAGHSVAMFRDKFWITLLLTIPTLDLGAHASARRFGYTAPHFPGIAMDCPAYSERLCSCTEVCRSFEGAMRNCAIASPGMMTLIALAITSHSPSAWR